MANPTPVWSLYDLSSKVMMEYYNYFKIDPDFRTLPESILFDIYFMFYRQKRICALGVEFSNLDIFSRMLKVTNKRLELLKSFQTLMDHEVLVAKELSNSYVNEASVVPTSLVQRHIFIDLGINLGGFLSEAGWYKESERVLSSCWTLCETLPECTATWRKSLECAHKLLHAQSVYFMCIAADETRERTMQLVNKLQAAREPVNLASLYTEYSLQSFYKSDYDEAYWWSMEAVRQLTNKCSARIIIQALSQASKSCIVKREFNKAGELVRQAVYMARDVFGPKHPNFADTLLDYGFYLLNSDCVKQSVAIYKEALELKKNLYGRLNLHVAVAQEDLAYALYVHEYSSGLFRLARDNAEKAINMMKVLLPPQHLMLASAQRVKALILEEMALDNIPGTSEEAPEELMTEAERLHMDALRLARISFGEDNVQTAKHYGNLGRLYQSMHRFKEAEEMHLKAIDIKERLVGPDDYEVGLSVGHLASLYNYHMQHYHKAEKLYFRSIKINLQLYSEAYSGLEYDYRGLIHVYSKLGDQRGVTEYTAQLAHWRELRETLALREVTRPTLDDVPRPLQEIKCLAQ